MVTAQFGLAGPLTVRDQNVPTLEGLIPANEAPGDLSSLAVPAATKPCAAPVARLSAQEHQARMVGWVRGRGKIMRG